ncbi:MAG: ATP-binding cassette domain-containing protein [Pseudomonadales bacterium]|jgi:phosphonate transport system ATP-binding protein|nr:ATP-binding cassette domain-containing protein [Pseudomonadales bacterium]
MNAPALASAADSRLEIEGLAKVLPDGTRLLEDVGFTVRAGEFVALLGASGAGKSLTLRCVLGLTRASAGRVSFVDGSGVRHELAGLEGAALRRARRRMGVIFQGANLVPRLRVIENVMIGRLGTMHPVRAWLYGFRDDEARAALLALERTNVAHLAHRVTGSLSGGELQRVAIARAIHQEPDLFLADEPISSLDPGNARAVMELLRPLAHRYPVLGVFHQPEVVARYCTRCIALKDGRVYYDGAPDVPRRVLREIYGEELEALAEDALPEALDTV